jgi:hypothetical protein
MPENATIAAPAAAPTAAPQSINQPFSDMDAEFEKQFGGGDTTTEPAKEETPKSPPSKPAAGAAKPSVKKEETPTTKTGSEGEKSANPATKPSGDTSKPETSKTLMSNAEFRKAFEDLKAKHKALEAEHGAIKNRPPQEDPEKKELLTKSEQLAKKAADLEEKLKFTDYEQSDEYKDRYFKPYAEAFHAGRLKTASFSTQQKIDPETGSVLEASRKATADDFDRIMSMDDDKAADYAVELFGQSKANLILWHRENILQKNSERSTALEEFRKTAGERSKTEFEARQKRSKTLEETFNKLNTDVKTKHPQLFAEVDGDEEGNALLKKGYDRYTAMFNGGKTLDADGQEIKLTDEQVVQLHSEALNKAAAFNRLARSNKKATERIKELETELEQFKSSEPKGAEGVKAEDDGAPDWDKELMKYAMK